MPEIQKYSLKEELKQADDLYSGKTSLVGMSALTQARYINSTRTQMFTSHLKQFLNLVNPEFPRVFTNAENVVGKHSSGYKKAKSDLEVIKKVEKFGDILDTPFIYHLFVFDKRKKKYKVITRREMETGLTEDFAYHFNNDTIDQYDEGDIIDKGTVLYKSDSYDENMNYRYGRNATVVYVLDPFTSEDAAVISKSFSEKMTVVKAKPITFGLNNNDIPINLYGDEEEYKPYPDIGEPVSGIFGASRSQYNEQLLFDFKDNNLRMIKDSDRVIYYKGKGFVLDYEIYCNNPEIEENAFNHQILKYLNSQNKYYKEILKITKKIIKSGCDYDREIDYLYKRASEFLDEEKKWKDESIFGNIEIRVTIAEYVPLKKGHKFTGRYGNKSVVSKVLPDEEMPYTEDGRHVDVKLNLLAIVNRTTGFVPHELFITFICTRAREQMKKANTLKEKENILFNVIKDLNEKQYKSMYAYYKQLSTEEKKEYIEDCIVDGIYIHQNPVYEDEYIFFKLMKMKEKYEWLKPYQLYFKRYGREYPQLRQTYLGEMYMLRLKQTDDKQFSARNTGAINIKELPERSYKNRNNQELHSDTAIRFGEYESLGMLSALSEEDLAIFHAYYRTSIKGRRDLMNYVFDPFTELTKVHDSLTSRVAEFFYVIFKSLSLELECINEDDIVKELDDSIIKEQHYEGEAYFMTDYKFYLFKLEKEVRKRLERENPGITTEELDKLVNDEIQAGKKIAKGSE